MIKKLIILLGAVLLTVSCSIQKLAINKVSDMLSESGSGTALTGDEDPEFVADALPFALKMYEILLDENPEHEGLLLTSGMGFIMYANAFIQTPASMLPGEEYELQEEMMERAKKMYIRGRNYVFRALEVSHPGFRESLETEAYQEFLQEMTGEDVTALYWAAAGWMGAISINIFDVGLTIDVDKPKVIMDRAYELEPDFGQGMIDDFYILYYASMPEGMGGSEEKARFHFARAVELSEGNNPSPYVSLATSLSIQQQNSREFRDLLGSALAIDIEEQPENKLANIITQRKARWYLDHIEDFFLLDEDELEAF